MDCLCGGGGGDILAASVYRAAARERKKIAEETRTEMPLWRDYEKAPFGNNALPPRLVPDLV